MGAAGENDKLPARDNVAPTSVRAGQIWAETSEHISSFISLAI